MSTSACGLGVAKVQAGDAADQADGGRRDHRASGACRVLLSHLPERRRANAPVIDAVRVPSAWIS
jgi:hypothetical protein